MKPGDDIAIIGPDPIGLLGVMTAKANGASTIVVSGLAEDRERLEHARKFGAVAVIVEEQKLIKKEGIKVVLLP